MDPQALVSGVDQARPSLQHFVDSQLSRHELSVERLVLMGFSQGAMLALDLGLRLDPPPAAIMAYSGALLRVPRSPSADRPVPPIMLRHGDADQVVPPDALMTSIAALSSAGASAVWSLEAGLPHGISPGGLAEGARFLRAALAGRLKNWTPSQRANAAS
jgi:phospholipase/carboxylesterase